MNRSVMANIRRSIVSIFFGLLLFVSACGSETETINIVQLSNLGGPDRIDFYEIQPDASLYLLRATIQGESPVDEFIEALATPMELGSDVFCIEQFHMHVVMLDGREEVFELVCSGEPNLIRGDQDYFGGNQAARVPEEVTSLLNAALDRADPLPQLASDAVVPTVTHKLLQDFPELDGFGDLDFRREDLSAGMIDVFQVLYTSRYWSVDVSWPDMADPVFDVAVALPEADFEWTGHVEGSEARPGPIESFLFKVEPQMVNARQVAEITSGM